MVGVAAVHAVATAQYRAPATIFGESVRAYSDASPSGLAISTGPISPMEVGAAHGARASAHVCVKVVSGLFGSLAGVRPTAALQPRGSQPGDARGAHAPSTTQTSSNSISSRMTSSGAASTST